MISRLFERLAPGSTDRLLDPGCGEGAFIEGVLRWCKRHKTEPPEIVGIEQNPERAQIARDRFAGHESVNIITGDYLRSELGEGFEYIVGNPPYVNLMQMSEGERNYYRQRFKCAAGRFDLYLLFFERALSQLDDAGRLVFVTPEKWLYVATASPLRDLLAHETVEYLDFMPENSFPGRVTYPVVTSVRKGGQSRAVQVTDRDGAQFHAEVRPLGGRPWWGPIHGHQDSGSGALRLADVCSRISAGIATGADRVFVLPSHNLAPDLSAYAYPTISGRELEVNRSGISVPAATSYMLAPYDEEGSLLEERDLGPLGRYLKGFRAYLTRRTCAKRKPWYAFHDSFPLTELRKPKILCKDITSHPRFWIDYTGEILPRHSVYYLIPRDQEMLEPLVEWLNSNEAATWLQAHCHRAANGFLRLQSRVLERMPIPEGLATAFSSIEVEEVA